jgi:hypothetical protein
VNPQNPVILDHPDKPGFWWYRSPHGQKWQLVEARDFGAGGVCLYALTEKWGGHQMGSETAREGLPGEWVFAPPPS